VSRNINCKFVCVSVCLYERNQNDSKSPNINRMKLEGNIIKMRGSFSRSESFRVSTLPPAGADHGRAPTITY
jgi:hypothetical protein